MNPGRELDALIAEKVMGWKYVHIVFSKVYQEYEANGCAPGESGTDWLVPRFSEDISDAWAVAEYVFDGDFTITVLGSSYKCSGAESPNFSAAEATAGSAPHAICLAALKAVGG
jgi:hypothetical protein